MFIRSNMSISVTYNKSTGSIVLKPKTVTYVADEIVTAEELKGCYGDRIEILTDEEAKAIMEEQVPPVEDSKTDINPEGKEENEGEEANTGDEAVDDFLNGKTDVVPEGTTEITEEEALKLKEQADAEAKVKEEAEKLEALKAKEAAEKAAKKAEEKKVTKGTGKGRSAKKNK